MKKYKVAFIGTGGRSCSYGKVYATHDEIDVVALADPVAGHRAVMRERTGLQGDIAEYDDWRDMLGNHSDLDGVVIATPNYQHADQDVACLERGLPIATEKPLATTKEDCERIIDAERANGGRTLIGFVLRSTPFYSTVHRLLQEEALIGRLVSVQADELPGWGVSSIMNRSPWRRYTKTSGGSMLEKSCHDLDVFNWMVASRPVSLNCYGGRNIFVPNPSLPETCDACGVGDKCKYYKKPVFAKHEDESEETLHDFIRDDHACIYNVDKDVVDTMSVNIEYENGVVVNFMLNFNAAGPRAGRNFHAVGIRGRVWGNLGLNELSRYDNQADEVTDYDVSGDGSDHGGGGRRHSLELLRMMKEPDYRPDQNAAAGYLSAVMCFATDISRVEGRRVGFRYGALDRIELV